MGAETGKTELLLVAAEPYPIHAASAQWCKLLGVSEHDLKGCGFKVFDSDFRPHTQSKLAEYGSKDNLSDQVNAAMVTALEQRRIVYVGATLELDAKRAAEHNSPPTRKVSLSIEPLFQATSPQEGSAADALPAASQIRVTLMEQDIFSMKEAMHELANGRATVLSSVSKPYRITLVTQTWKESFGYTEGVSVGRSIKMIEGPLTQHGTLLSLYEALGSGAPMQCKLVTYRADGRPLINHIRAVPVQGDLSATQLAQHAQGSGRSGSQLMAHASGVTHCLWYMETHEAALHADAMSDAFYANSPKMMTAPHAPFTVLDVNDEWTDSWLVERRQLLGKPLDQALGAPWLLSTLATTDARKHAVKAAELVKTATEMYREAVEEQRTVQKELLVYRSDGKPLVQRFRVHPVIDDTGDVTACIALVDQSMSHALNLATQHSAAAALVVSASFPHKIVHANEAWRVDMVPDYMQVCEGMDKPEPFAEQALSSIALVAPHHAQQAQVDDLMKLTKGEKARILVAHKDAMRGCGAWVVAAVAPVLDLADNVVTHLVLSLDLSVAGEGEEEPQYKACPTKSSLPGILHNGILMRSCEDVDQTSGSSSDEEEQEEKVGVGMAAMAGHVCGGLLQRTCEEREKFMSWSEDEEEEDEEYYMDSEEEQELMGCKLPQDQLLSALTALLHQRQEWQEEEGGATQPKPSGVSAPHLSDNMPSQRAHRHKPSEEEEEDDMSGYADDESAHDLEQSTAADQQRCAREEGGSEDGEGCGARMPFRDTHGKLWSNSEVVTGIRIHVNEGETIAPIYEEYLAVLRDKGFVESWSWPHHTTLSLMVPFGVVEKATSKSAWCSKNAPDLRSPEAWWLRLRNLVAVLQYNSRRDTNPAPPLLQSSTCGKTDKDRVESIMMPRGAISRQLRDVGLASLRDIKVVESWTWDSDDAVRVLLRPERLREQCSHSDFCNLWAPRPSAGEEDERHETWGVCWLRLVWLTTRQPSFVAAAAGEELHLDLETCLSSLHLHGLLPYD